MARFKIPSDVVIPPPHVINGIREMEEQRNGRYQPAQIPLYDQAPPPGYGGEQRRPDYTPPTHRRDRHEM